MLLANPALLRKRAARKALQGVVAWIMRMHEGAV